MITSSLFRVLPPTADMRAQHEAPIQSRAMNIQRFRNHPRMDHFWNNSGLARLRVLPASHITIQQTLPRTIYH